MALRPSERLASAKDGWARDASDLATLESADSKYTHLVANAEPWLPVPFDSPCLAPSPRGDQMVSGSCVRLLAELESLNADTWRASAADIESWQQAGVGSDVPSKRGARFGFAVFHTLARRSVSASLPMKLDYWGAT